MAFGAFGSLDLVLWEDQRGVWAVRSYGLRMICFSMGFLWMQEHERLDTYISISH